MLPATIKFLKSLKKHNDKSWFDDHREHYLNAREDFGNFIQEVIKKHGQNDPGIADLNSKNCLYRINRDVRFSKDKSPYKTNLGASICREGKKSGLAGYYFHLEPGKSFAGGGLWQPSPDKIKQVRQEIDYCLDEFNEIVSSKKFKSIFGGMYEEEGIKLSRVPQGFEKENPAAEYLKLKSWLVIHSIPDSDIISGSLTKKTVRIFEAMQPFLKFLNRAIEIKKG